MELIDENGNLFGRVNVIDAIAVLLLLTVVVAGIALLDPFESTEEEKRYVTIDLGEQFPFVAEQVSAGDVMTSENSLNNLTITDVYVTPAGDGNVSLTVRAEVEGQLIKQEDASGKIFQFSGQVIRLGRQITVTTEEYDLKGRIVALEDDRKSLNVEDTGVVVKGSIPASAARKVDAGDTVMFDGQALVEVTSVYVGPSNVSNERTIILGLQLNTISRVEQQFFAGRPLQIGRSMSLDVGEYTLSGTISELGSDQVAVEESVVTLQTPVSLSVADQLEPGTSYEIAGRSVATIESVTLYPTSNSNRKRAVLEVTLQTVREEGGLMFGAHPVQIGASLPIETDVFSGSGKVIKRGSLSESGTTETVRTIVRVDNVPPEIADAVTVGMDEQSGRTTFARVTDKRVEPAIIVLTSESGNIFQREHPRNKDVYLTLELQVRSTSTGTMFHGARLQQGDEIILDFGSITVKGTVIEFEVT